MIASNRALTIDKGSSAGKRVVYWMSRDQRAQDNWALLHAYDLARARDQSVGVLFNIVPQFLQATRRQYEFMIKGLEELESNLSKFNIPLFVLAGDPAETVPAFVRANEAGTLVTDFSPLRIAAQWRAGVSDKVGVEFIMVDAHNVVPCWIASTKQEFAARTLRPKIRKLLPLFLEDFPRLQRQERSWVQRTPPIDWAKLRRTLRVDATVSEADWCEPGARPARKALDAFLNQRLTRYAEERNDPTRRAQSGLSPYLHFGHLSAQRVALEAVRIAGGPESIESFLEELIVRRELSDNFCYYNQNYDSFDGFPDWARKTLDKHRRDPRETIYNLEQFELARTHDPLWNAAQNQMVREGKMHGYMRMYWAKKILEWSSSPEEALRVSICLNDKYELDGRDPNGYAGIAWSIGGVHDRPWFDRPVYGAIRYMNDSGMKKKFDVAAYIRANS